MYVSGTLKDKAIDFYREKMVSFDNEQFQTEDASFSYDGQLVLSNKEKYEKLIERQEMLIDKKIERIREFNIPGHLGLLLCVILETIRSTPRNYTYALLDCLSNLILSCSYSSSLETCLYRFQNFISYLMNLTTPITQVELDLIVSLFLNDSYYSSCFVQREGEKKFHLGSVDSLSMEAQELIQLGEFVAPNRVSVIAQDLQNENEFSHYVAPIYFALRNEKQASFFLHLCRDSSLDDRNIEKNARLARVPNNLIQMVRR